MKLEDHSPTDLAPINRIRVETALSRYPIHRLAKRGEVAIDIRELADNGEVRIRWEVSHNSKYGQPGPLAYKIDTLIVNRRIEESARPIPRIVKLGCLKEICRELGIVEGGKIVRDIKTALYQNSGAFITSKTRYRQTNGKERTIEFGDTRYGVVFTGETLPDGRIADAVYIVLHDFYREILDSVITRPLDYEYLQGLAPAPQRLYEILSYQIYSALKLERPRAKLLYSELCSHGPQTRYQEFDKVKKQMYKIHQVHVKSGYIAKVNYEQTTDANGDPDWVMLYQPGAKAIAEYQAFTRRSGSGSPAGDPLPLVAKPVALPQARVKTTSTRKPREPLPEPPMLPLVAELVRRSVTVERASELVELYPERIERQIEVLDWYLSEKPRKIDDPAAWLVKSIERNNALPKGFTPKADRERQAEAARLAEQQACEQRRRRQESESIDRRLSEQVAAYRQSRTVEELSALEAEAIAQASNETRSNLDSPALRLFRSTMLFKLVNEHLAEQIRSGQLTLEIA